MSLVGGQVLLTGATGGIGQAIARAFSAAGAQLTLTGRRLDVLEPLAAELGARALACDLADRRAVGELIEAAEEVDVLIANAAIPASGHIAELTQDQVDTMLEVNLRAPIALARGLLPGMVERGRGHLVFVSSLSGKAAAPSSSLYSATKFGLRGFALGVREDLREAGVGASVVLPGFISDAGMFSETQMVLPRGVGTRTPEQVAEAIVAAVARNRAEVTVAPPLLRLAANFASVAPAPAAWFARVGGSERIALELASRQLHKRPPDA
jgi:short-subunit dehydrogenase